jgi:acetyl-CoA C-acetyltransferase
LATFQHAVILSATRTPIGSFRGQLAGLTAPELGAIAVKSAVAKAGVQAAEIGEVILGNVLGAGQGQAPARQAAVKAGKSHVLCCSPLQPVCP